MSTTDLSSLTSLTEKTIGRTKLRISPVEDRPTTYNMLIYGEPGVGKTVFCGSASELEDFSPVLILDVEGGTLSLKNTYPKCEVVRVKTWKDIQELYNALYEEKGAGFRTIVVDSLSEIGKFCMTEVMIDVCKKDPERDFDVPSVREWGITLERMRRMIRGFRDLEYVHTFMTAHIRTKELENGTRQKNYPALNGQLQREAAGFFDFVFYLYTMTDRKTTTTQRILMTAPNDKYVAKDRSGRLPILVEDPTVSTVMSLILGESAS